MSFLQTTNLIIATAIAMAVTVWIPLALKFIRLEHRDDPRKNLTAWAERLVLPAAGFALVSLMLPPGSIAGLLALPWVAWAFYLAWLSVASCITVLPKRKK